MLRFNRRSYRTALLAAVALSALTACSTVVPRPKVQQPPETGRVTFQPEQAVVELQVDANDLLEISYDKGEPLPGDLVGPIEFKQTSLEDVIRTITRPNKIAIAVGAGAEDKDISISVPDRIPLAKAVDLLVKQAGAFYYYSDGILHIEGERTFSIRVPNVLTQSRYKDLTEQQNDVEREQGDDSKTFGESIQDNDKEGEVNKEGDRDPALRSSTIDAFAKSFEDLGATNVSANNRTGLISFYADKNSYGNIAKFLSDFETNRDLIIYDAWIYEVQLSDAKKAGINWNDFQKVIGDEVALNMKSGLTGTDALPPVQDTIGNASVPSAGEIIRGLGGDAQGVTLGVGSMGATYALDAMFKFLNGQGEAKTLAQPTIAAIGGRESTVFVGESVAYINQVNVKFDNTQDSNGDGVNEVSSEIGEVNTRQLKTGLRLGITGDVTNGMVESDIGLSFVELLQLSNIEVGGTIVQLPRTAERSLNTTVRARPGDIIMLGGLIFDKGTRAEDGLLIGDIPLNAQAESTRRELVMMLRPRIIKFRPNQDTLKKAFTEAPVVVGPNELEDTDANATTVITPETPADVIMRKDVTGEKKIIDGIKADESMLNLADEARKVLSGKSSKEEGEEKAGDKEEAVEELPAPPVPATPAKPATN